MQVRCNYFLQTVSNITRMLCGSITLSANGEIIALTNKKIVQYTDELNDEFSGVHRNTVTIDHSFVYHHANFIWRFFSFILYRCIMTPIAFIYLKYKFHLKVVNNQVLKKEKFSFFMYGNHTQLPGDGYIPSVIAFPKNTSVIVNADNISLPGTKTFMTMIGAVPIPNKISGMRGFTEYMKFLAEHNRAIAVYPEAHIWPYYTKIRPFKSDSFRFPVMHNKKTFCFTVTYQRRRFSAKPAMTVFVDGPFLPDGAVSKKEAAEKLRNEVFRIMTERSKNSTYEYISYVRKEN